MKKEDYKQNRRIVETMAKCNMDVFRKDFIEHGISNGDVLSETNEELGQCIYSWLPDKINEH